MDFEYWYFVFVPVLFFAGWFCRGLDQRQRDDATNLPEAYSHGLSLLLNGETDKAIDTFVEVVRIDPDLVDLHHCLATCFAREANLSVRFAFIGIFTTVLICLRKSELVH